MPLKLVKFKEELKYQLKLKMAHEDGAFYKGSRLWLKELNGLNKIVEIHYVTYKLKIAVFVVNFQKLA